MGGGKLSGMPDEILGGNLALDTPSRGGVVMFLAASCYGN